MNFNSQPPRLSAVQAKRGKPQKPQKRSCLSASIISSRDMISPDSAGRYQRFISSFDKPIPHLRTHLDVADINRMRTPLTVFVICDVCAVYCGDSSNKHRRCCCCFTIYCSVEQSEIKGSVVFASAPVFYKELMNVSKLRCRMEPGRCAAVRSVCYFNTPPFPLPRVLQETMLNVEAVESCGFTVGYTNDSRCGSVTDGQYMQLMQN